jgi:histidine ammonia-lyase
MRTVTVTGDALTLEDLVAVARGQARAELGPDVEARMEPSRAVVTDAVEQAKVMYGITTGFGALADTHIGRADLEQMQLALVRSHSAGVGEPLPDEVVRGLLLLRARTLTVGYSGVRIDLPRRLLDMLEHGLLPVIPGKGSVGASGDLAQLAHLAQPLVGEGRLRRPGEALAGHPAAELLAEEGSA